MKQLHTFYIKHCKMWSVTNAVVLVSSANSTKALAPCRANQVQCGCYYSVICHNCESDKARSFIRMNASARKRGIRKVKDKEHCRKEIHDSLSDRVFLVSKMFEK